MNGFSPELLAKTKVNLRNMYGGKRGLTCKSLVSPGLLLLSNIETDRGRVIIYEKNKNQKSQIKTEPGKLGLSRKITKKVSDIRFMCNINYM